MPVQTTSIASYNLIKPELPRREEELYDHLALHGPLCNVEIADDLALPINSVTPTTFALRQKGLVVESHRAKYAPTNRTVIYWKVAR